jgi:hypothetical protein
MCNHAGSGGGRGGMCSRAHELGANPPAEGGGGSGGLPPTTPPLARFSRRRPLQPQCVPWGRPRAPLRLHVRVVDDVGLALAGGDDGDGVVGLVVLHVDGQGGGGLGRAGPRPHEAVGAVAESGASTKEE